MRTDRGRLELLRLIKEHGLSSAQVGALVDRNPGHVRAWRAGLRPVPPNMLRLLELELKHGRGRALRENADSIAVQG